NGANPLDSSICHNLLEAAERNKPITVKKAPISAEIFKDIIDKAFVPKAKNVIYRVVGIVIDPIWITFGCLIQPSNVTQAALNEFMEMLRIHTTAATTLNLCCVSPHCRGVVYIIASSLSGNFCKC
ncbi:hypothetical protein pdam_00016114, partial [Pocillopora damicornis]